MHQGVQRFLSWLAQNQRTPGVSLNPPATTAELAALERSLAMPIPADLRFVLARYNGGTTPSGLLLHAGDGPDGMEAALRQFATTVGTDFLDPELPLPFQRTAEGSVLAFDRSAGPVSDTWSIVDYFPDTAEMRLVYRTFDGWCQRCVADWSAPDFSQPFSVMSYLSQGERHVAIEPDVSTAHATVAHARKRAGEPEEALASYLKAARCVPSLPWCDWEALKLAALLGRVEDGFEAGSRLCARAPAERWKSRETVPARVAALVGKLMAGHSEADRWLRLFDQLIDQAGSTYERATIQSFRHAALSGETLPALKAARATVVPADKDLNRWWSAAEAAYKQGTLRDEDLLLDPAYGPLAEKRDLVQLLRIRREF